MKKLKNVKILSGDDKIYNNACVPFEKQTLNFRIPFQTAHS